MTAERLYQAPLAPIATVLNSLAAPLQVTDWHDYLVGRPEPYERICLDRYVLILSRLQHHGLYNCSLLDLGCSGGFFAAAFALTIAAQVTAVDDARALPFGYSPQAFLAPLRTFVEQHALRHVEVLDAAIEDFLAAEAAQRQWDVVLCLSVLHHYRTGYGDRADVGALTPAALARVYHDLGRVTGRALYLEVDASRIGSLDELFGDLCNLGHFAPPRLLGWSCSAPGVRRAVWELMKRDD